jgi:hypothetical protein
MATVEPCERCNKKRVLAHRVTSKIIHLVVCDQCTIEAVYLVAKQGSDEDDALHVEELTG